MTGRIFLALGVALGAVPATAQDTDLARADYASVLEQYVDEDGAVDYAAWQADSSPTWASYLNWLGAARPSTWPLDDQRAFWINAYNASVVDGVLKRYPLDSVRDVGFLGGRIRGFFGRREHMIAGEERTLDEIEKELLRAPGLWDPRIAWALSPGRQDAPPLRTEPYEGSRLDTQLEFQARVFINGPHGHRLDREDSKIYLTWIFDRYDESFAADAGSIRAWAARYLTGDAAQAALDEMWEIESLESDDDLNDRR